MKDPTTPGGTPHAGGLPGPLRAKLSALRAKLVRVELLRRLAIAVVVPVVGLALLLACDWWVDLPMGIRVVLLGALGVATLVLLAWSLAAIGSRGRDDESLALMVERARPGFRSRLISSVQFAMGKSAVPEGASRAMVERLVQDTEEFTRPVAFTEVVNTTPLKRAMTVLALVVALAAVGYFAGGPLTRTLLRRAFLSDVPVPRATQVVWTTGDLKVGRGDEVVLQARAEGDLPPQGELRVRLASGRRLRVPMPSVQGSPGTFASTLPNLQESFSYVVAVNDGRSERGQVRVLPRPVVVALTGRQTYRDYTKLPPSDHQPGEFLLFPGSELALEITASQPLREGSLRLLGPDRVVAAAVDPGDPTMARAAFTVPDADLSGFTVQLVDEEGMASRDATVYRVDILADESPSIRITKPARQRELVTAEARVLLAYEAEDRFGVDRVVLFHAVGDSAPQSMELPVSEPGAKRIVAQFDWPLERIEPALETGDEVRFWIEASDQNAATPPGRSAERILEVVTARAKREDLLSRAGDFLDRVDEAAGSQERINAALADWLRAQAPPPPPPPQNETQDDDDEN